MELSQRQQKILAEIRQSNEVGVDALAELYQVSSQTIRRDINILCDRGLAARTHGGARLVHSVSNVSYGQRRELAKDAKQIIGALAAGLIPENSSLMLNIGTTTEQESTHTGRLPDYHGTDIRLDELHGVVDSKPCRHRTTR